MHYSCENLQETQTLTVGLLLNLLRMEQWTKNVFVLAGCVFANQILNVDLLTKSIIATISFCLISSSVYVFNDCMDLNYDKDHPRKKNRPIANGLISVKSGFIISAVLLLLSLIASVFASNILLTIIITYFILNLAYSLNLKKLVIIDVFCIACGFMLRIFAGTLAIGIEPSEWIIICTMMLSLFLGFSKRYAEMTDNLSTKRMVISKYDKNTLLIFLSITLSCTIMSYGLYTISDKTVVAHNTKNLIYSLPIVMFGLLRYLYIVIYEQKGEDTFKDILKDSQLKTTLAAYIIFILSVIIL